VVEALIGLSARRHRTNSHAVRRQHQWLEYRHAPQLRYERVAGIDVAKAKADVDLKTYCAQAANGIGNTGTFLGERLRRLTRCLGGTKAMCAGGRAGDLRR
jgi:hypothetical protein